MTTEWWEDVEGVWVGAGENVSPEMVEAVHEWMRGVPPGVLEPLASSGVVVYVVRRLRDFHAVYGGGVGWEAPGSYSAGLWKEGGKWRRGVLVAEEWIPAGLDEWVSSAEDPWSRVMPHVLLHEIGHVWDESEDGVRSWSEPFRSTFLNERRAALDGLEEDERAPLAYFVDQHWTIGRLEVWAEAFAAYFGPLPPGPDGGDYERVFWEAFSGCCEIVGDYIDEAREA